MRLGDLGKFLGLPRTPAVAFVNQLHWAWTVDEARTWHPQCSLLINSCPSSVALLYFLGLKATKATSVASSSSHSRKQPKQPTLFKVVATYMLPPEHLCSKWGRIVLKYQEWPASWIFLHHAANDLTSPTTKHTAFHKPECHRVYSLAKSSF